jgi:cation-transporting ATPase 13A3/4/5
MQDLFIDEVFRPLYIFIIFSLLLWTYEEYFYYCIMIFVTAAFGIGTSLVQTYRINKRIYEMAYF